MIPRPMGATGTAWGESRRCVYSTRAHTSMHNNTRYTEVPTRHTKSKLHKGEGTLNVCCRLHNTTTAQQQQHQEQQHKETQKQPIADKCTRTQPHTHTHIKHTHKLTTTGQQHRQSPLPVRVARYSSSTAQQRHTPTPKAQPVVKAGKGRTTEGWSGSGNRCLVTYKQKRTTKLKGTKEGKGGVREAKRNAKQASRQKDGKR